MLGVSRRIYTGVFRFVLVSLLAIVFLIGTTFLIAVLLALLWGNSWNQPINLIAGLSCGLICWLFVAIFHLRHETHALPIAQREPFLAEAKTILHEMGYTLSSRLPDNLTFRPSLDAFLFGGSIRIVIEGQFARLTGPKVSLEIFRRLYRLQHHVHRVQHVLHEHRRFTENLLKRIELRLRLKPSQFEAVRQNIIDLLAQDGNIICELNLLVQSEHGIRENLVEFQICEWLEQHGIAFEVHKDVARFVEVLHPEADLQTSPA